MVTRTQAMPVFWPDLAQAQLGDERWQAALEDPDSVDLLTWNVFATLETHFDPDWLAYRLQMFAGTGLTAPVRLQLWTGRDAEPLLAPSRAYAKAIRERVLAAGVAVDDLARFTRPLEVPVRLESPDLVCLVEVMMDRDDRGFRGRDRLLELIDAGLEHASRLGKHLSIGVVIRGPSESGDELGRRLRTLRDPVQLAAVLPHRDRIPAIEIREVGWQQLLEVWGAEAKYLSLPTSPKPFLRHVRARGLLT